MTKRTKIGKYYVERNRLGQIKKWVSIRNSLRQDRLKKSKNKVTSGYGHRGDQ
jgi:hypothetical protein